MGAVSKGLNRRPWWQTVLTGMATVGAFIVAAPSLLAATESIHFDFDPLNPSAVHQWIAPEGVTSIEVQVAGGGGGGGREAGGRGALVQADIAVVGGTTFHIGIGGGGGRNDHAGGGGGASIMHSQDVLLIAGGGGGGSNLAGRTGGSAANNLMNGAGGSGTGLLSGDRGRIGIGGTGHGPNGENFDDTNRTGGAGGAGALVGGPGGEGRSSGGGGGGAGYGGGGAGGSNSGGGAGGSTAQGAGVSLIDGATSYYSQAGGAAGVRANSGRASTSGGHGWVTITWATPPARPKLQEVVTANPRNASASLALETPADMTCTPTGPMVRGAWVRLPTGRECSRTSTIRGPAGAHLLGWSTTLNFPIELATEHAANTDTALEIFDDDGRRTAIFIPAGGWTHMTGDNTLFPIWSSLPDNVAAAYSR